jgi:hypothetical protein
MIDENLPPSPAKDKGRPDHHARHYHDKGGDSRLVDRRVKVDGE